MSRFDYVAYDAESQAKQAQAKELAQRLEYAMEAFTGWCLANLAPGRARTLATLKMAPFNTQTLEEVYMWIGKSIRDEQIYRNGSAELQEGRGNE